MSRNIICGFDPLRSALEPNAKGPMTLRDISLRYTDRWRAEQYRDRFRSGRRRRTHLRETAGLRAALERVGNVDSILDVGSGPGRFVPILSSRTRRLVQADFSEHMLNVSRADAPLAETCGGYVRSDARQLPFRSKSFDVVFCHRLLNHVASENERRQMLSELTRVARRFVLTSCLEPPTAIRVIREVWRGVTGRASRHAQVRMHELIEDAAAVGLTLAVTIPIHTILRSALFLVLRIR